MKTVLLEEEEIYRGWLLLVNKEHRYREQRQNLSHVGVWDGKEILYESKAYSELDKLMKEINGWESIVPVSAWRSLEEQQKIWDQSLRESGLAFTKAYVAVPGHSEHQTGLAIDLALNQPEIDFIRPYFPYEGICQKFRRKAAKYGFVQRYQEEKQVVTQIGHEPWHFRYVGTPHAEVMVRMGFALEEYITFLKEYRYGENPLVFQAGSRTCSTVLDRVSYRISYVEAAKGTTKLEVEDTRPYSISGNNCDGFIITEVIEKSDGTDGLRGAIERGHMREEYYES